MDIKVFVSNLGAYNNGVLTGQWTTLPVDDVKDIYTADKKVNGNVDGYGEEYFISDYEAPFKIDQYDSLEQLNNLAELLADYDTIEDVYNAIDEPENVPSVEQVYVWDDDETLNAMFEQACAMCNEKATPANVIRHDMLSNYNDEYVYVNDLAQVKSMSQYQVDEMFKNAADEIVDQFKDENL